MAVNAVLWAVGLEGRIAADADVGLVGPYQPTTFNFNGYVKGVKPADIAGWDTPIPPTGCGRGVGRSASRPEGGTPLPE